MSKFFTSAGTYAVEIIKAEWEQQGNPGEPKYAMIACLTGQCKQDGETYEGTHRLYFNNTLVSKGQNAGKRMFDLNAEALIKLGMPKPFDPGQLALLEGAHANFVVQEEEYKEKKSLKVKFCNPLLTKVDSIDAVKSGFASLMGGGFSNTAHPSQPVGAEEPKFDENGNPLIPF